MKQIFLILTTFLIFFTPQAQTVSSNDLKPMVGNWAGLLSYLNYSDNKEVSIKATLTVVMKKKNFFVLNFDYPDEAGHGSKEKYQIRNKGRNLNNQLVLERTVLEDGSINIVLEEKGKDGNDQKPSIFHHVLVLGINTFTITKLVKFENEDVFFQRNKYLFSR
jgi:hypothetical protein